MKTDPIGTGIAALFDDNAPRVTFDEVTDRTAVTPLRPVATTRRWAWFRRGPVIAGLSAVAILAVAVPLLLLPSGGLGSGADVGSDPLAVGADYVWPEGGFEGTSDEIAVAFAASALGWTNAVVVKLDPEAPETGPVWTTVSHTTGVDSESFDVLSVPLAAEDGRRVLMQVGSGVISAGLEEAGDGQRVDLPPQTGAVSAVLHIRLVDPDRVITVEANEAELRAGVHVNEDSPIGGVVIVYRDAQGDGLTAVGGHFGPLPVTPDADVTPTTMAPDPELEAELISRAIVVACGQTCTEHPTYVRESLVDVDDLTGEEPMPGPVSDAIRGELPGVTFISPDRTDRLDETYSDTDTGDAVVINVSPVQALADSVFGVDVGVSFYGFHGQTIQFQWDGSDWVVADSDQTGVTVTSVVS